MTHLFKISMGICLGKENVQSLAAEVDMAFHRLCWWVHRLNEGLKVLRKVGTVIKEAN